MRGSITFIQDSGSFLLKVTSLRCQRLNKDCQRPAAVPRMRKAIKKSTKVDRLEEKLDGLVSLLKSNNQSNDKSLPMAAVDNGSFVNAIQNQAQPTPDSLPTPAPALQNDDSDQPQYALTTGLGTDRVVRYDGGLSLHAPILSPDISYTASGTRSTTSHSNTAPDVRLEPNLQEAEEYLVMFREQMMHYSPFMPVTAVTTAQALRRERPFLWLCIMAILSKSTEQQKALGREIRITIGREMFLEGKNNLDLLIGLLTYNAW